MPSKSPPRPSPATVLVRALSWTAYLGFLGFFLFVGSLIGWLAQSGTSMAILRQEVLRKDPEEIFGGRKDVNLLVLGCDVNLTPGGRVITNDKARADMILVARLDFANGRISGVSIPRDTGIRVPGYSRMKINGYHAIAKSGEGGELMKQAVETALPGVLIDRVITLDYEAFKRMVDAVGGVEVKVEKRMKYDDNAGNLHIDLRPGVHKLDGLKAMGFVRFRHSDSDYKRQERQKQFMVAFKDAVIRQPATLTRVADEARAMVGSALTDDEVAGLVFFARRVPDGQIKFGQVPVVPRRGTTMLKLDDAKLGEVLREYHLLEDPAVPALPKENS